MCQVIQKQWQALHFILNNIITSVESKLTLTNRLYKYTDTILSRRRIDYLEKLQFVVNVYSLPYLLFS